MTRLELSGLARLPLIFLERSQDLGLDREELMRDAGLAESELSDPDARIPVGKIWSLWRAVINRVPDEAIGLHLGESITVRHLGLVGYTLLHSRTLGHALIRVTRYSRILSEALQYSLEDGSEQTRLILEREPRFDLLRHPIDTRLASMLAISREITGVEIVPVEVCLPYPRPADSAELQRFYRAPLKFGAPKGSLALRKQDVELPVVSADLTLVGYLDELADTQLRSLATRGSFCERVGRALWTELSGGQPGLKRIASVLGVSARTLQRRLRGEGTSFGGILETFRREMAERLLRDRGLAVYEVAFLLGYSDPSTFYRAFRRWKQVTPHEFRQSQS